MAGNRSSSITDRLEDVLGGVEDEIRRAEERLHLNVFRGERTAAAGSPEVGLFPQEERFEDLTQVAVLNSPARRLASRIPSRAREAGDAVPPTNNNMRRDGRNSPHGGSKRRNSRRRGWGDLDIDIEGFSRTQHGGDSDGIGGGGGREHIAVDSARGCEAIVNKLLMERDARLAARGRRGVSGTSSGVVAAAATVMPCDTSGTTRPGHRGRSCHYVAGDDPDEGYSCAIDGEIDSEEDGGGSGGNDSSPGSIQGDLFFASDLIDPDGADHSANGANDDNAVPRSRVFGAAIARPAQSGNALLLRRQGDDFGTDYYTRMNSSRSGINDAGDDRFPAAALMRPPPPPPGNEQDGRPLSKHQHAGDEFGRVGREAAAPTVPMPTEQRRTEVNRGRSTSGDGSGSGGSSSSRRFVDENDAAATARLEDQISFQPRKTTQPSLSLREGGKHNRASRERRIEELARNRRALYSERERRRQQLQEEAETKECTFRPNIAPSRVAGAAWGDCDSDEAGGRRVPLHERLHKEARNREAARALAHHHLEKEVLRECTFQPTLTAAATATCTGAAVPPADQRPLHERVWEIEREREHRLRLLLADKEEREGATFAPPPLGRVSERLAARERSARGRATGGERLATRLQEQAMWARGRRRARLQEHEEAEARDSTFEPSISRGTQSLVRKRPNLQAPFEERQAIMDAKRQERERLRQAARAEEETGWFNPTTAKRTHALLRRRMPQRLEETVEQRVARMAGGDDQRRRVFVMDQKAKEKAECTFRPALNPVTQSMGQAAPLDELVNNRRGLRVKERAKAKVRDAQACSHKPVLVAETALSRGRTRSGATSRGDAAVQDAASDMYGPGNRFRLAVREPARMTAELRAREREQEERMNAVREEREVAEMQRCTFVPQTNPAILRAQGPVLVRGLGRHLELKEVAQQMEQERQEREVQAFGVRRGAVRRTAMGETLVEPFNLSSQHKGWWQERKRRYEEELAAKCTFRPWTVEAERGRALSRLLDWSTVLSSESSSQS